MRKLINLDIYKLKKNKDVFYGIGIFICGYLIMGGRFESATLYFVPALIGLWVLTGIEVLDKSEKWKQLMFITGKSRKEYHNYKYFKIAVTSILIFLLMLVGTILWNTREKFELLIFITLMFGAIMSSFVLIEELVSAKVYNSIATFVMMFTITLIVTSDIDYLLNTVDMRTYIIFFISVIVSTYFLSLYLIKRGDY